MHLLWYSISSVVLGVLLFFPMRKFILAISVNKLQRKENREIKEGELMVLKRRATYISAVLSVTFAFIYNKFIMLKFLGKVQ